MTNNARRTAATQSTSTTTQTASAARTSNQRYTDKLAGNPPAGSPIQALIDDSLAEWREFQKMQARAAELQYDLDIAWFALGVPVLRDAMNDLEDAAAARANDPEPSTDFERSLDQAGRILEMLDLPTARRLPGYPTSHTSTSSDGPADVRP
jgi:hypothetical protein